jgi:hypothetical protein
MKGIELTQSQIKAYENGATMFLFPITTGTEYLKRWDNNTTISNKMIQDFIRDCSPIKKGDKDIFVKEDFRINGYIDIEYFADYSEKEKSAYNHQRKLASQMTKKQSRYFFSECIDVRVVRVQKVSFGECTCLLGGTNHNLVIPTIEIASNFYNQQMQEQGINRTYEDNDYVFLVEFRR